MRYIMTRVILITTIISHNGRSLFFILGFRTNFRSSYVTLALRYRLAGSCLAPMVISDGCQVKVGACYGKILKIIWIRMLFKVIVGVMNGYSIFWGHFLIIVG